MYIYISVSISKSHLLRRLFFLVFFLTHHFVCHIGRFRNFPFSYTHKKSNDRRLNLKGWEVKEITFCCCNLRKTTESFLHLTNVKANFTGCLQKAPDNKTWNLMTRSQKSYFQFMSFSPFYLCATPKLSAMNVNLKPQLAHDAWHRYHSS